jgi:hypothetical protein
VAELIVIGHKEMGPRRGMRLLTLAVDAMRGGRIDATGGSDVCAAILAGMTQVAVGANPAQVATI